MKFILQLLMVMFFSAVVAQEKNEYAAVDAIIDKIPLEETTSTDAIVNYINLNFKSNHDKIRATFYWTASQISYDVANRNTPNNKYSSTEKINYALKNKKGVCIHYAEVFNEIANKLGLKTVIIIGYVKQNGTIAPIGHAWNASKIDDKWYLFDPTWGAGYVNNLNFIKKTNNVYFKTLSSLMVQTHMPFDYLWQFSNEPISNNEFISGIINQEKAKINFDFDFEIEKYEKLSPEDKAFETIKRVEQNGVVHQLIAEYLTSKNEEFNSIRQNKNIEKVTQIVADYNSAIASLNEFIYYRNKKFFPNQSDEVLAQMINLPLQALIQCQEAIYRVGSIGKENSANIKSLKSQMEKNIKIAEQHAQFVKEYLSKNNTQRKMMFIKKR